MNMIFLFSALAFSVFVMAVKIIRETWPSRKSKRVGHGTLEMQYNHYQSLQNEVEPVVVEELFDGRYRFWFTPTTLQQFNDIYYYISLMAQTEDGPIGMGLRMNHGVTEGVPVDQILWVSGTEQGDRLLHFMAWAFGVSIPARTRMVDAHFMVAEYSDLDVESLMRERVFDVFVLTEEERCFLPVFTVGLDLENADAYIEEVDIGLRESIVDGLSFIPNVKGRG